MPKILKTEDIHIILKNSPYELVGEFKNSQVETTFKSKECGHKFKILWRNLLRKIENGDRLCKKCMVKKRALEQKLDIDFIIDDVSKSTQKEYKVLKKKKYANNKSKLWFLHKTCGEPFEMNYSNFKQGRRCPICANKTKESKAAQLMKRLLDHLNFNFKEEMVFDDLKNPFTDMNLRFDIYIEDLKTVIEIDGEQHFIPTKRFGGEKELIQTQYRDAIKNKYCMENDIRIIRVGLYDKELKKKKTEEEVRLEIFYLLNLLVDERKIKKKMLCRDI